MTHSATRTITALTRRREVEVALHLSKAARRVDVDVHVLDQHAPVTTRSSTPREGLRTRRIRVRIAVDRAEVRAVARYQDLEILNPRLLVYPVV